MIETIDDIIDIHSSNEKSKLLSTTHTLEIILNALGKWKFTSSSPDEQSNEEKEAVEETSTKSSESSSTVEKSRPTKVRANDSTVPIQLANILCELVKENTDLILPILDHFYKTISYLIVNNPSPSGTPPSSPPRGPNADPSDVINTAIITMFGNICFLFSKNQNLLSQSIPYVLDIGKQSSLVQGIVYSTLASEAVNQPTILAPFIKQLINYAIQYPNYFSILGGMCQYNQKEFESNVILLVESFEKVPEARASILEIIGHLSKNSSSVLAIIPYLARLKVALTLESLASHMAIVLKSVASRYPHILDALLLDDVIESINKFPVAKYSLIEVVGMSSASSTNRAYQYLVTLLQKQQRQSISNDSNAIVAILKGLRSIQKTTPDLLTSTDPFQRFVSHPASSSTGSESDQISEFIVTLAQEIIDNVKNYNNRINMISPLPNLANGNDPTTGIDVRVGQCLVELKQVAPTTALNDKYLLETYYSIILETLSLIPIPNRCEIITKEIKLPKLKQPVVVEEEKKDEKEKSDQEGEKVEDEKKQVEVQDEPAETTTITIYSLTFTFGHETIELHVQDKHEINVWKSINHLLSIVNLKPFLKEETEVEDGDSKTTSPFISFKDIQDIHKRIEELLEKTSLSPRCVASPAGASVGINKASDHVTMIKINSADDDDDDDDDQLELPRAPSPSLNVHPYDRQQQVLLHQGKLFKKSKYFKKDNAYWFELYPAYLIGKRDKEREKEKEKEKGAIGTSSSTSSLASNNANTPSTAAPLQDDEIKIIIKEIREIKMIEGERKKKMGIFKTKPNPNKEQKTFCITTAKSKFIFKAVSSEEKAIWINKIKQLYQQLVYRHHHNNGEFNFNQLDLTIPVNTTQSSPQKSPEMESANPSANNNNNNKPLSAPTSPVNSEPTSPRKKKKLMRRFTQYLPKMKN